GGHGDHEEGEDLAVVAGRARATRAREVPVVGDEGEVHGVEHQLDAHQEDEQVPPEEEAHRARREEHAGDDQEVLEGDVGHEAPSWAAGSAGGVPWGGRMTVGSGCLPRATATAPTTATRRRALESSNGTSAALKSSWPMPSMVPRPRAGAPN